MAVAAGKLQEQKAKAESHAAANGNTESEHWTANMPGEYLAQQKSKHQADEEEEESESEGEEEDKKEGDDEEEEDSEDSEDDGDDEDAQLAKKK